MHPKGRTATQRVAVFWLVGVLVACGQGWVGSGGHHAPTGPTSEEPETEEEAAPACGDGSIDADEECDDGDGANGLGCTPSYGQSCTYCSTSCDSIVVEGGHCGDGTCDPDNETHANCSGDCGALPPGNEDCNDAAVRCVGDGQEYDTISAALSDAGAGTVLVFPGAYGELTVEAGGSPSDALVVRAVEAHQAELGAVTLNGDHIRFEGFTITTTSVGINITGNDVDVINNQLLDVERQAINSSGDRTLIANNYIYRPHMGIVVSGSDSVVENNEVERLIMYGRMGDCDYSRFFGSGHVFRENTFHGTDFSETGDAHVDCFQTFDNFESAHDILLEDNVCFDFSQGLMSEATTRGSTTGITVRHNVFAHGGNGLIARDGMTDIVFDSNTIFDIRNYGVWMYQRYPGQSDFGVHDGVVTNNIVYQTGSGIVIDYQVCTATESHNIEDTDPLFEDPDNDNFTPRSSSPACGQGIAGSDIGGIPCS